MPKLWSETIQSHRREVRQAIIDTTMQLVEREGLLAVTMSKIAEQASIGRATLYKYFPDVEAILLASLEHHVDGHLAHLIAVRDGAADAGARLADVLQAFALMLYKSGKHWDSRLAAVLHNDERFVKRERQLYEMLRDLLSESAGKGIVRDDVPASELATYCLNALAAARGLSSVPAVNRLVRVTLAGLQSGP